MGDLHYTYMYDEHSVQSVSNYRSLLQQAIEKLKLATTLLHDIYQSPSGHFENITVFEQDKIRGDAGLLKACYGAFLSDVTYQIRNASHLSFVNVATALPLMDAIVSQLLPAGYTKVYSLDELTTNWIELRPTIAEWHLHHSVLMANVTASTVGALTSDDSLLGLRSIVVEAQRARTDLKDEIENHRKYREDKTFKEADSAIGSDLCTLWVSFVTVSLVLITCLCYAYNHILDITSLAYLKSANEEIGPDQATAYFIAAKAAVSLLYGTVLTLLLRFAFKLYARIDHVRYQRRIVKSRYNLLDLASNNEERSEMLSRMAQVLFEYNSKADAGESRLLSKSPSISDSK